jgi:hypothetical protein
MDQSSTRFLHYSRNNIRYFDNRIYYHEHPDSSGTWKPLGLWLSKDNAWGEWCEREDFRTGDKCYEVKFPMNNILVIDTIEKLSDLTILLKQFVEQSYQGRKTSEYMHYFWKSLASKYDGIYFDNYENIKAELWPYCVKNLESLRSRSSGQNSIDNSVDNNEPFPIFISSYPEWYGMLDCSCVCIWNTSIINSVKRIS